MRNKICSTFTNVKGVPASSYLKAAEVMPQLWAVLVKLLSKDNYYSRLQLKWNSHKLS